MQRALLLFVCLVCLPSLSGCIIPYAYPKLDFTRALQLDAPPGDVRVFRVDVAQAKSGPPATFELEQLTEISVPSSGKVTPQIQASLPTGVYFFMGALNYDFGSRRTLALRVYRPGFELVEVKSMERTNQLAWAPAPDLAVQERALDTLFPLKRGDEFQAGERVTNRGSISPEHRAALLYGAAEYERLAATTDLHDECTNLLRKATQLRERAEE